MSEKGKWNRGNAFTKEHYDRMSIFAPKGTKEKIKAHIAKTGDESLNGFVNRAIDETMMRDDGGAMNKNQ